MKSERVLQPLLKLRLTLKPTLRLTVADVIDHYIHSDLSFELPGSLRLSPLDSQLPALERDYRAMRDMFYREPPTFGAILAGLSALELEINAEKRAPSLARSTRVTHSRQIAEG